MTEVKDEQSSSKPQIKHDWYQTETHVTVNVLIKHLEKDAIKVEFEDKYFKIHLPSNDGFELKLSKLITPSKCIYRVTPTKIELKLKKLNEENWTDLEEKKTQQAEVTTSNSKHKPNWDKIVETELKDDASQGEAALNELFQKIYTEGSDEVKKAMNKSFLESGGTVLSTNWNEVGEKKVDIKPPEGMEWKKWEEP